MNQFRTARALSSPSLASAMAAKSSGRSDQHAVESLRQGYLAMNVDATYPGNLSTRLGRGWMLVIDVVSLYIHTKYSSIIIILQGSENVTFNCAATPHLSVSPQTIISPISHSRKDSIMEYCTGMRSSFGSTAQILIYAERLCLLQGVGRRCSCYDFELS